MTAADLLAQMSVLNNELDTSAGGQDETRCIGALNLARQYFEGVAATLPRVLSTKGPAPIATTASGEFSALPVTLLRIDKIWALDVSSSLPIWPLKPVQEVGAQSPALPWPLNYTLSPGQGQPRAYYQDSDSLYWLPIPDRIYSMRAYGLWAQSDFVNRASTFPYPLSVALPLSIFAVKYTLAAIDDPIDTIQGLAAEAFTPVLRALRKRDRSIPKSRYYDSVHTT